MVKKYDKPDPNPVEEIDLNQSVRSDRPLSDAVTKDGEDELAS